MKIICIENNYLSPKEIPVFSVKPETVLLQKNHPFFIPEFTKEILFETGLVLKSCKNGRHIGERFAKTYFSDIALAVNFTAHDILKYCYDNRQPGDIAKCFDFSLAISKFIPKEKFDDLKKINFHLVINGQSEIKGCSSEMNFSFEEIISESTKYFFLKMGDYIYTGGKKSEHKLQIGDRIQGYFDGDKMLDFWIK